MKDTQSAAARGPQAPAGGPVLYGPAPDGHLLFASTAVDPDRHHATPADVAAFLAGGPESPPNPDRAWALAA